MEHFVGGQICIFTPTLPLSYLGSSPICELHSNGGEERVWLGEWLHTQLVILEAGHTLIMKFYET